MQKSIICNNHIQIFQIHKLIQKIILCKIKVKSRLEKEHITNHILLYDLKLWQFLIHPEMHVH